MSKAQIVTDEQSPEAAPPASGNGLHIVLFGRADSGKSGLLAGLARAAESKQSALPGELHDVSGNLKKLQWLIYEKDTAPTPEEVVAYPVQFRSDDAGPLDVVFYDCSGRQAAGFLKLQKNLEGRQGGVLGRAILKADALILALDVSSSQEEIKEDFRRFVDFIGLLERSRSRQTEVSGMPVYLALTKCDLLARQGDSFVDWSDRVADRKRDVEAAFRRKLAERLRPGDESFGKIDLHVMATAKKRPQIGAERPGDQPYQVAELFRQCLLSARDFHFHRRKAQQKLHLGLLVAGLFVLALLFAAGFFYLSQTGPETKSLERRIRSKIKRYNFEAAERFDKAKDYLDEWKEIEDNPHFRSVKPFLRAEVRGERELLAEYRKFEKDLENIATDIGRPDSVKSEGKLDELKTALEKSRGEYENQFNRDDWRQSRAAKKRKSWLNDVRVMQSAAFDIKTKYRKLIEKGAEAFNALAERDVKGIKLRQEMNDRAKKLPNDTDAIPDSKSIQWQDVKQLQEVRRLVDDWEETRLKVEKALTDFIGGT